MGIVIKVENISKQYRLGEIGTGTLRDDFKRFRYRLMGKEDPFLQVGQENDRTKKSSSDYVWALRDVNFEINQGDVVGIIGRNGAGKSTLLKILSRTTTPTTGSVKVKGRIASLLEVGTGFHGELSGRENIYLNGAIMGLRAWQIDKKLDEIIDFAGVEKYLDTPVKRYSSGMYVRLAFAVAAHLDPDILIVDEVLAVGDAEFQKKCLGKMKEVSELHGRTVILVSHNMETVYKLSQKCIYLKNGELNLVGESHSVLKEYLSRIINKKGVYVQRNLNKSAFFSLIKIQGSISENVHMCMESFKIEFQITVNRPIKNACLSFQILDNSEKAISHIWLFDSQKPFCREIGEYLLECHIPSLRIYMGEYSIKCYLSQPEGGEIYDIVDNICSFEILMFNTSRDYFQWNPKACTYLEESNWVINKIM